MLGEVAIGQTEMESMPVGIRQSYDYGLPGAVKASPGNIGHADSHWIYCWGDNANGELGNGIFSDSTISIIPGTAGALDVVAQSPVEPPSAGDSTAMVRFLAHRG